MEGRFVTVKDDKEQYTVLLAPKQKLVRINKYQDGVNFQANYIALKDLSNNGYILYMYLMLHNSSRLWALSSKDATTRTSLSMNTYPKAVHELIEKGYLVKSKIDVGTEIIEDNAYDFYESPALKEVVQSGVDLSEYNGRKYY